MIGEPVAKTGRPAHGILIHIRQIVGRDIELRAPIGIGPPGGRIENESDIPLHGSADIGFEITFEPFPSLRAAQKRKRRKAGKIDTIEEDERRLETAIGQKDRIARGWKGKSAAGHGSAPAFLATTVPRQPDLRGQSALWFVLSTQDCGLRQAARLPECQ
jgi:hypothetical protein